MAQMRPLNIFFKLHNISYLDKEVYSSHHLILVFNRSEFLIFLVCCVLYFGLHLYENTVNPDLNADKTIVCGGCGEKRQNESSLT